MPTVRINAHAKVNLALALAPPEPPGGERAGWHQVCSWMHAIDLADEVLVEPLGVGAASTWSARWAGDAVRPGPIDWPVWKDLAWRALRAIERHTGRRLPTRIALTKRIPTGAGLGGGSSDAAAALAGIDRAWGLGLGPTRLGAIGATLGSDVPFFLDTENPPRPAVVRGFGERIERTSRVGGRVLVLVPGFGCPTGAVFAAFDRLLAGRGAREFEQDRVRSLGLGGEVIGADLFNDLADAACVVRPGLAALRQTCAAAIGAPVYLTGSGSGMFAAVGEGRADGLADRARRAAPGLAVRVCRLS